MRKFATCGARSARRDEQSVLPVTQAENGHVFKTAADWPLFSLDRLCHRKSDFVVRQWEPFLPERRQSRHWPIAAGGLGMVFYVTYTNGLVVKLWAQQGAQGAQGGNRRSLSCKP